MEVRKTEENDYKMEHSGTFGSSGASHGHLGYGHCLGLCGSVGETQPAPDLEAEWLARSPVYGMFRGS